MPAAVADLVRRNNLRNVAVIFAALLLVGCHESGTWQDDAGNWKRIFRAPKPDDIRIVHSWFWRSPHFTYEYEYYIHIEKNADLQHRLLTTNQMKQLTEDKDIAQARFWSQHKPTWFAPKPAAQYEVWMYSNAPSGEFRLLIDRDTHDLFLSDRQY